MKARSSFKITAWEENPFSEVEKAGKLTRASVKKTYSGEIEGEGVLEYLMSYNPDGSARFFGYERVTGSLAGKSGSFVFQHSGKYANDEMNQDTIVVEGSGTGELEGLQGACKLIAGHWKDYPFALEYELPIHAG